MDDIIEEIIGNKTTELDFMEKLGNLSNLKKDSILESICCTFKINTVLWNEEEVL